MTKKDTSGTRTHEPEGKALKAFAIAAMRWCQLVIDMLLCKYNE